MIVLAASGIALGVEMSLSVSEVVWAVFGIAQRLADLRLVGGFVVLSLGASTVPIMYCV